MGLFYQSDPIKMKLGCMLPLNYNVFDTPDLNHVVIYAVKLPFK